MVTQEELEKMSPEEIAQLQKDNCIFCKIVRGEIPSKKVYEDKSVLAILDINPARKGHVLVMPKEHFPILPLIPPQIFQELFSATKLISKGIRDSMLVNQTTIFIANGAVAGQQSPHFLFHIIPRDSGDGISNFDITPNPALNSEQAALEPSLKNNLNIMLSKILPIKEGTLPDSSPSVKAPTEMASKHELIAKILDEHQDVRESLIDDPVAFKEQIKGNPQLEKLFDGIDIQTLSDSLKDSFSSSPQEDLPADSVADVSTDKKPEVFLGEDPYKQRSAIFEYFESKPKAKQMLIDNPAYFKELLDNRPDIKDLFADVNIDLLSVKLKELEGESDE